jgi:50S ribosomal protein L16 3-hydroxylase
MKLNLDKAQFLADFWQQKPLLIRQAIADFIPPISSHELAGLAFEDEVESRIIEHAGDDWLLEHGPFSNSDYQRRNPWTLLVQAVDHYAQDVADLRKLVDFIPQWRVDDVMVSYATDGGSVGPHYDNYDVFLLQGEGQRLWRTGQHCDASAALLPHDGLRILSQFHCEEEYLLEPGDILYLPPGLAHWGIAQGECTTFSIGFRAPRINDMLSRFADALLAELEPDLFYHDARMEPAARAGEIRPRDLERVQAQIQAALDQAENQDWFGELVTEPRYAQTPDDDDLAEARVLLQAAGESLSLSAAAKLAWRQDADDIVVFANGESRRFSSAQLPMVTALCADGTLDESALEALLNNKESSALLDYLLETGCVYVQ